MPAYFVTGTDTDAGKTFASCAMLCAAMKNGLSTAALKPVAAGVTDTSLGLQNEDVVALSEYCSLPLTLEQINPTCFPNPVAPHIGAAVAGELLQAEVIAEKCRPVLEMQANLTLVEGAGGWKVPLNQEETLADVARLLELPVILVVGMRLGCLSHAILTAESVKASGLMLAGWIGNQIDPGMAVLEENLNSLSRMIDAPRLGSLPWLDENQAIAKASSRLSIDTLL